MLDHVSAGLARHRFRVAPKRQIGHWWAYYDNALSGPGTMTNDPCEADQSITSRIAALNWTAIAAQLDTYGAASFGPLLSRRQCQRLAAGFDGAEQDFRSHIVMARHGFGRGHYKYWSYPLPPVIAQLRRDLYVPLAAIANRWRQALGDEHPFPNAHDAYLKTCHSAGQTRPTPLLLKYQTGDYNCLHQDLYGELVFPLQVAILLSEPGTDFTGGEFIVTEQRPRMQSRAEVITLRQGEAVVFAVNARPVQGSKGTYRVKMRHGVSRLHGGTRFTAGIIFHDAR